MKKLQRGWHSVLDDFDFPMADFHAKDLLKQDKFRPLLIALAKEIAKQQKAHPVSYGIIVDDFNSFTLEERRFMTGATFSPKTGELLSTGCPSKPYFVPFQNIVKLVCDYAPVGGKAHFNFGLDRKFSEYARELFEQISTQSQLQPRPWSTWNSVDRLGSPHFPLAKETPELQAADLLVHLTYQHILRWLEHGKAAEPCELLATCLANSISHEDHKYQDRECLEKHLAVAHRVGLS